MIWECRNRGQSSKMRLSPGLHLAVCWKSEIRNPKSERLRRAGNPKSEIRIRKITCDRFGFRIFFIPSDFGFRFSDF